ncbi:MFS transporter [Affinibrenneria salicis]|uniref:MFS transporter n=1 Tax=Affinibrenneria salicis TaxID=2590031 RepID=A0A5J5FW71_9GAMM|nr:MFS transporter [Affinibrenneria salicis]KAA8998055.1 MFS transporter [Affinibrenneria salicis]
MPLVVYILALTIFSLTTSEFMVAGMMPALSDALDASLTQIGRLISLYAAGMVVGGPLLTLTLLRLRVSNKKALLWLLSGYALAQSVAAMSGSYPLMAAARVVTGVVGSACFGVALAICAELVSPGERGRAASVVVGGLMLSAVFGVPMASLMEQYAGWRASFWLIVVLTLACALIIALLVPARASSSTGRVADELAQFSNRHLWAAYASSGLIIGATFAAFSYFIPILTGVSGFSPSAMPWLFALYGLANVAGNMLCGRYADRYTLPILAGGLSVLTLALLLFALFAYQPGISLAMVVVIGLTGVSLNPAMIARVMKTAHPGALVNTLHTSVINIGLGLGAFIGGLGIERWGLTFPLWIGALLALVGLLSLVPYLKPVSSGGRPAWRE